MFKATDSLTLWSRNNQALVDFWKEGIQHLSIISLSWILLCKQIRYDNKDKEHFSEHYLLTTTTTTGAAAAATTNSLFFLICQIQETCDNTMACYDEDCFKKQ